MKNVMWHFEFRKLTDYGIPYETIIPFLEQGLTPKEAAELFFKNKKEVVQPITEEDA